MKIQVLHHDKSGVAARLARRDKVEYAALNDAVQEAADATEQVEALRAERAEPLATVGDFVKEEGE
jgi:hypothetical protein